MSEQQSLLDEPRAPGEVRITDPWPKDLPWPHTVSPRHGFAPEALKRARVLIRELAIVVVGERPDKAVLLEKLERTLRVELNDFVRYNQTECAEERAAGPQQAWPAQVQER